MMPVPQSKRLFTVDEYHRMADAGILRADERVELIEGEVILRPTIGSRHAGCVNRLTRLLVRGVGDHGLVAVQNPVHLSDLSEPVPDLAVLRPRPDDYTRGHPQPADVLLLIEVADTTVGFDRGRKAPLYAVAGVPELWLVDIPAAFIEVFREPGAGGYGDVRTYRGGETVRPVAFPGLSFPADAVLP